MGDPNRNRGARQRSRQWLKRFEGTCGWGSTGRSGTPAIPRSLETAVARAQAQMRQEPVRSVVHQDHGMDQPMRALVGAYERAMGQAGVAPSQYGRYTDLPIPGPVFARVEIQAGVPVLYRRRRLPIFGRRIRSAA